MVSSTRNKAIRVGESDTENMQQDGRRMPRVEIK